MIGFYNLWLILIGIGIFSWIVMEIADKLRGARIENKEDHRNVKISVVSGLSLLVFLIVTMYTPIVIGILFWIGCFLIILAGIIYVLSIMAFIKAKKGLTIVGIYKVSRNPMYVAMFLIFTGFVLMTWQFSLARGILMTIITTFNIIVLHWMVLGEEHFLSKKHRKTYNEYMNRTPRYIGIPKSKKEVVKYESCNNCF